MGGLSELTSRILLYIRCKTCISQNGKYSEEERKAFQRMYNSMRLVNSDTPDLYRWQIMVEYPMRSPIAETFHPDKSNRNEAEQASLRVLRKLKKQNLLPKMEQAIAEMIEIGTLVELTPEELQALPTTPHHFTYC